jgi:hypothetical protein
MRSTKKNEFLERYNLIFRAYLWYQLMRTPWSYGHVTHSQERQILESQISWFDRSVTQRLPELKH